MPVIQLDERARTINGPDILELFHRSGLSSSIDVGYSLAEFNT